MPIHSPAPPSRRFPSRSTPPPIAAAKTPPPRRQVSARFWSKGKVSSPMFNTMKVPVSVLGFGDSPGSGTSYTGLMEVFDDNTTSVQSGWSHPYLFPPPQKQHMYIFFLLGAMGLAGTVYSMLARTRNQPQPNSDPEPETESMPMPLCDTPKFKASKESLAAPQLPTFSVMSLPPTRLPKWWPASSSPSPHTYEVPQDQMKERTYLEEKKEKEDYTRLKEDLTATLNMGIEGPGFEEQNILAFRRKCKVFSLRFQFRTVHERDSFYHAAVNMVLDKCTRVQKRSASVLIDDEEDARQFLYRLSEDIKLENSRAISLVGAAIAGRAYHCFVEAGIFELEGRSSRSKNELFKISQMYTVFPPTIDSPEILMLGHLIKADLSSSQRERLLLSFQSISSPELHEIATVALGFGHLDT